MKMQKILLTLAIMILIMATATGCGPSGDNGIPTEGNIVNIEGNEYFPEEITIKQGESVIWISKDTTKHSLTFETFYSPLFGKDEWFEHTFDTAGTYTYIDPSLTFMNGTVIVTE